MRKTDLGVTLNDSENSILLNDYMRLVAPTDRLPMDDLHPVLLGLFGEVGSVMATAKKLHREKEAYAGYRRAVVEEFGDTLWYFAALCRRLHIDIEVAFSNKPPADAYESALAASNLPRWPLAELSRVSTTPELDASLLELGQAAATLLQLTPKSTKLKEALQAFADTYLRALQSTDVAFAQVAQCNVQKTRGRFLDPDLTTLPTFDYGFDDEERLPDDFQISITQRRSGKSSMQWNGVFIGDPLSDNILDKDGYRFHDVFHFAHAAILHWSPVIRALIKQKRKSRPEIDEAQDGGRAIVVEEGLTAWIFSRAKELNFFEHQKSVSFDLLKTVQQFVAGYEVEQCPLKLWEDAILQGYSVFRQVCDKDGGIIVGNRAARTLTYKPLHRGSK